MSLATRSNWTLILRTIWRPFLGTLNHVEVTASPGGSHGIMMGQERQGHDQGLKTEKVL